MTASWFDMNTVAIVKLARCHIACILASTVSTLREHTTGSTGCAVTTVVTAPTDVAIWIANSIAITTRWTNSTDLIAIVSIKLACRIVAGAITAATANHVRGTARCTFQLLELIRKLRVNGTASSKHRRAAKHHKRR